MPISDCGFPPIVSIPQPGGNAKLELGRMILLRKGPTIQVEVGFETTLFVDQAQAQAVALSMATGTTKPAILRTVEALIDTGAGDSCIDEDLAKELSLPLIDKHAAEKVLSPICASTIKAIGFLVIDALHFILSMQRIPRATYVRVDNRPLDMSFSHAQNLGAVRFISCGVRAIIPEIRAIIYST